MPSRSYSLRIEPFEYLAKDGRAVAGERGRFSVPIRRGASAAGLLELVFVRLPAVDLSRAGAPTIFLTGGPGISAIATGRGRLFDLFQALRSTGDVILLDQRGCGLSTPSLVCDHPLEIPIDRPVTREEYTAAALDSMRRCVASLAERGIDIAGFNTNESADDVAGLAAALGYERVNLLGWSYGSHLAMAVMRRHPDRIARVVLAGPEGPDHTYKLPSRVHTQLARLSALAGFNATAALHAALEQADHRPVRLPWRDGLTAAIGRFDVEWVLSESLADRRALRRLPAVLSNMASGDFRVLVEDELFRGMLETFRTGLFRSPLRYCVDCASGVSDARWEKIQHEARGYPLGRTIDWPFPEICQAFGDIDLGDAFRARLRSNLKVLFITGTLDCRTPGENVLDLAPGFLSPRHFVVDDAGHSDLLLPRVVHNAVTEFLHSGNLDASHTMADPPFVPDEPRATLVYDGDCAFCRAQAERVRRRVGGRVELVPFQAVGDRFPAIPRDDLASAVHLITPEGQVFTGARAILAAASSRSRLARAALHGYRYVPGFAAVAESVYRLVGRNRRHLGH